MARDDRLEVAEEFRFIGRTFEEYRLMFDLDVGRLQGTTVLDCPGGPASFAATACQFGVSVTAIDPMYGESGEVLSTECADAVDRTIAQLSEKRDLFVWDIYGDVETRGRYLRAAYERFLADRARNPRRYVAAALPSLPFENDAFDLVLSGSLLFLYDDRLSQAFHVDALRELARVGREVRVFPLASLAGERSASVEPTVEVLSEEGFAVNYRRVPYDFQPGATEMLVLSDPS